MMRSSIIKFESQEEDEMLLEGDSLPLDAIRSSELAVECWNLRNSLSEADESYSYTKKDLKMQKYYLRRVQNEQKIVLKTLSEKDITLKNKNKEIEILNKKISDSNASKRCIISSIAKSEYSTRKLTEEFTHLQIENVTLISQLAAQESSNEEKYNSMELILTLDAQQAEKERDELEKMVLEKDKRYLISEKEIINLNDNYNELKLKYEELQKYNITLEDKCVWGLELEQAYEILHCKLEVAVAEKDIALTKVTKLEREMNKMQSYALSEGIQLPSFADNNNA